MTGPTLFSVIEIRKINDHKRYEHCGQAEAKNEANVMAGDARAGALGTYPARAGSPIGFFIFGRFYGPASKSSSYVAIKRYGIGRVPWQPNRRQIRAFPSGVFRNHVWRKRCINRDTS